MRTMAAGNFKQTCLRVLDEVRETREPVIITKRGVPVAKLVPLERAADWLGSMRGTATITGDIVSPALEAEAWEVLRE